MASLSFNKDKGMPVGRVEGGEFDKETIYVDVQQDFSNIDKKKGLQEIILKKGKIMPMYTHYHTKFPLRCFVVGMSGSGKSTYASYIIKDYKKRFKENDVILFSAVSEDPVLDKYKPTRVECDESIYEDPVDIKELHNSLVVMDDIAAFADKRITEALNQLRDKIMETGRHENIGILSLSQFLLEGHKTKSAIKNAFQIVTFPHVGGKREMAYYLKDYQKMDKDEINRILNVPSRWVCYSQAVPQFVMYERGIFIL